MKNRRESGGTKASLKKIQVIILENRTFKTMLTYSSKPVRVPTNSLGVFISTCAGGGREGREAAFGVGKM